MNDSEAVIRFREYNFEQDSNWKQHLENLSIFDEPGSYAYENKLYRIKKKYYHTKVEPILSILGDDDYKKHVTYKKGESDPQTNTDEQEPKTTNQSQEEPSSTNPTQPVQGGFMYSFIKRHIKSLTTVTVLNLSIFISCVLSFILQFFSTGLSLTFYRQAQFSSLVLYGATYIANHGFSMDFFKHMLADVYGLYFFTTMIFFTSSYNFVFLLLMGMWSFIPLPSLVQRYMNKNNIHNYTLQNLLNKAVTYSPQAPYLAARTELFLLFNHILGLFGSDRHIMRTLFVLNYVMIKYSLSPPLRQLVQSIKLGLDQLSQHSNCPHIVRDAYEKIKQIINTFTEKMTERMQ